MTAVLKFLAVGSSKSFSTMRLTSREERVGAFFTGLLYFFTMEFKALDTAMCFVGSPPMGHSRRWQWEIAALAIKAGDFDLDDLARLTKKSTTT